ncbi:MAG: DegT/DnrJ/EryC1/StrS family aminotransferase [Candidatus Falkowbacteria bacterium]
MNNIINIYPYNKKSRKNSNNLLDIEKYLSNFYESKSLVLGSARAGIYQALKVFNLSRRDHILVPDFLCQSILNIINTTGFPVKYLDKKTKAVLLLHQWGYPQDMDKILPIIKENNLFIIEDCAHGFSSKYKGKTIGTFGDLAVFSFSKMFPTYTGGALISKNRELINIIKENRNKKNNIHNKLFNILATKTAKKSFNEKKWRSILDIIYLKSVNYPNASKKSINLMPKNIDDFSELLNNRNKNYSYIIKNIKQEYLIPDLDKSIESSPMAIPVFIQLDKLNLAQEKLKQKNIEAEILHFDINRNMFNPDYRKCLAIPCHQNLNINQLNNINNIINKI